MTEVDFKNRKVNTEKLISFGFNKQNDSYIYSADIIGGQMAVEVTVCLSGKVYTKITDLSCGDEYVLHNVETATGAFVGQVKAEYEAVINEILDKCFEPDIYKNKQTKTLIEYVREKYGDELEFLWKKSDNAIWRRKDTQKWYAALLFVSKRKLGIDSDETVEILDLRIQPENLETLIDNQKYYPGYHMNKKHWYTVCLDGSVSFDELCKRLDTSYSLALK